MPEIPLGAGNTLKPSTMNLRIGDRASFEITGTHTVTVLKGAELISIPVRTVGGSWKGSFPLNLTNRRILAEKLGKNSDTYIGAQFDAIVVPQRNPNTNEQVLSWNIDRESITSQARLVESSGGGETWTPPSSA
jgi:hypothetical protein